VVVIWNGRAGSANEAATIQAHLETMGTVAEVHEPQSPAETEALAREAGAQPNSLVIAAGGDGTVHSVVNGIIQAGGGATLGIIPLGTGNDLCRSLAIPLDPAQALDVLDRAIMRSIDVVHLGTGSQDTWFANVASAGNSIRIMECMTDEMKQKWGPWCYLRGAVNVLGDLTGYRLRMSFPDRPALQAEVWNVIIANGRTAGGGVAVAPHASLEDGLLDVIVILDSSPLDMASLATQYLLGDYTQDERVIFFRAAEVTLDLQPRSKLVADGEPLEGEQFKFSIQPGALSVLVGPDYQVAP
jgi:diacylglycerol kinase (ATP)